MVSVLFLFKKKNRHREILHALLMFTICFKFISNDYVKFCVYVEGVGLICHWGADSCPPAVIRSPTPNVASQCCRDLHLPSIVWGFANVSNALSLVELVACGIKQQSRYQIWTVVSGMQDMCIRSNFLETLPQTLH